MMCRRSRVFELTGLGIIVWSWLLLAGPVWTAEEPAPGATPDAASDPVEPVDAPDPAALEGPGDAVLDPLGCRSMTDAELRAAGYEPVRAHGAVGDDKHDDTKAIQTAIDTATRERRAVYLHPGRYLVRRTLEVKQAPFDKRGDDRYNRFGNLLIGSYCGAAKPTIRLADDVAPAADEAKISADPYPVLAVWRQRDAATRPKASHAGRDWNQVIRNLTIVVGDNPGAIGIRHKGAEGSSIQEVTIDATGGFAGLYHLNASGGYTYDLEIRGGRYGIYVPSVQGGAVLLAGLRLAGQTEAPIAINHFGPLTIVGFDIQHDDGRLISTIVRRRGRHALSRDLRTTHHQAGGHIALIDGRLRVGASGSAMLVSHDRSVYLKNVFVRGARDVLLNTASGGTLRAANAEEWFAISEYAASGPYKNTLGVEGKMIRGEATDDTYFDGRRYPVASEVLVTRRAAPPADLIARHTYDKALCNVEGRGVVFVTDHGADPNDPADDTRGIQEAIRIAEASGSHRVFLPAGRALGVNGINKYRVSGTLSLGSGTRLCGVSRYASVLDARNWHPTETRPVIESPDSADAAPVIADFKIWLSNPKGSQATGYRPHAYAIKWQSGRNSVYRDVFYGSVWGDPGNRRTVVITSNGGGRWYGVTQKGGFLPGGRKGPATFHSKGALVMSPDARHLWIEGTSQRLNFYPFHLQHLTPPGGAQAEIRGASQINLFAIKGECATTPVKRALLVKSNPAESVPVLLSIRDSADVALIGYEGLCEQAAGRGIVEITDSKDITIANMGQRDRRKKSRRPVVPKGQWYYVKAVRDDAVSTVNAKGFLALFKGG